MPNHSRGSKKPTPSSSCWWKAVGLASSPCSWNATPNGSGRYDRSVPQIPTVIAPLNGVIQMSGGQQWIQRKVTGDGVPLIGEVGSPVTMRWNERNRPHNLYVDTTEVRNHAEARGLDQTPPQPLFEWGALGTSAESATGDILFDWSFRVKITWQWTGTEYVRFVSDDPHNWRTKDGEVVEQVATDTLVVLKVDQYVACPSGAGSCVPASVTVGENDAMVFANGQYVAGTWERDSIDEWFALTSDDGNIITIPPGPNLHHVVPGHGGHHLVEQVPCNPGFRLPATSAPQEARRRHGRSQGTARSDHDGSSIDRDIGSRRRSSSGRCRRRTPGYRRSDQRTDQRVRRARRGGRPRSCHERGRGYRSGCLARCADRLEGPDRPCRTRDHCRFGFLSIPADRLGHRRRSIGGGGGRDHRAHRPSRVRLWVLVRERLVRAGPQSMGSVPFTWRLVRRVGGSRVVGGGARGDRHRHRRIGTCSRRVVRHRRFEGNTWASSPHRRVPIGGVARHRRTIGQNRRRRGCSIRRDPGSRSQRSLVGGRRRPAEPVHIAHRTQGGSADGVGRRSTDLQRHDQSIRRSSVLRSPTWAPQSIRSPQPTSSPTPIWSLCQPPRPARFTASGSPTSTNGTDPTSRNV